MSTPYRHIPAASRVFRELRRRYLVNKYRGHNVECVACGQRFDRWHHDPETGGCPNCGAQTRHRLLVMLLRDMLSRTTRDLKALMFAPDSGTLGWLRRQPKLEVLAADIAAPNVDVKLDITNIALPSKSFDLVLCCHVLEHVPNDGAALREIFRVLKRGGRALLQVPYVGEIPETEESPFLHTPAQRAAAFGQFDHVRRYGRDFSQRILDAGFELETHDLARPLSPEERVMLGLWEDLIFDCRRPVD